MVKALLAAGAKFDMRNYAGQTPFHYAVSSDSVEVVSAFLEAGATVVDAQGENRESALQQVSAANHVSMFQLLLRADADIGGAFAVDWTYLSGDVKENHSVLIHSLLQERTLTQRTEKDTLCYTGHLKWAILTRLIRCWLEA